MLIKDLPECLQEYIVRISTLSREEVLSEHLSGAMDWSQTLQGHKAWCNLNDGTITPEEFIEIYPYIKKHKKMNEAAITKEVITNKTVLRKIKELDGCPDWKITISNILKHNWEKTDTESIIIPPALIQKAVEECTPAQIGIIKKEIPSFIEATSDKNAFVKTVSYNFLENISEELFGHRFTMQIADAAVGRVSELKGRALFFHSSVEVELLPAPSGSGTVVKITNK